MPAVPLPEGFVDLAGHPYFDAFDAHLNEPARVAGISRPEHVLRLTANALQVFRSRIGTLRREYAELYNDAELFAVTRPLIAHLTTDRYEHAPRRAIVNSFDRLRNDVFGETDEDLELDLMMIDWRASRSQRWFSLAQRLEISVPNGFRLYRGVHERSSALKFVPVVLKAWLEEQPFIAPKQSALASWAFRSEAAKDFTTNFGKASAGILVASDIPLDFIHANKLLDGGDYLLWWRQHEASVGEPSAETPILAIAALAQVYLNGSWYTFEDRFALEAAITTLTR